LFDFSRESNFGRFFSGFPRPLGTPFDIEGGFVTGALNWGCGLIYRGGLVVFWLRAGMEIPT